MYKILKIALSSTWILLPYITHAYTINDALNDINETNSKVLTVKEDLKSRKAEKNAVYSELLPDISVKTEFSKAKPRDSREALFNEAADRASTLNVSQELFKGGGTLIKLKQADHNIKSYEAKLSSSENETIYNAIDAYESVLNARQVYELNLLNEQLMAKHLQEAEARHELGESTVTDVSQAKAKLAEATSGKANAATKVITKEAEFEHIIGYRAPDNLKEVDISKLPLPNTLEEFLEIVHQNNPSILDKQYETKAKLNDKQIAYTYLSPRVYANARFVRSDQPILKSQDGDTYTLQVYVPILENGGVTYSKIKKAKHEYRKSNYDLQEQRNKIREKAISAWSSYETSKVIIESTKENVVASEAALRGVEEEAKVGTRTTLDVLQAERDLFKVRVEYRNAIKDQITSFFGLHSYMGTLKSLDFSNG